MLINIPGTLPFMAVIDDIAEDRATLWAVGEDTGSRRLYLAQDATRILPNAKVDPRPRSVAGQEGRSPGR